MGAIAGAGLALLLAPKSGAELREDLSESMSDLNEAVCKRVRDLAERAGIEYDNLHASVEKATEVVETTARDIVEQATPTMRKVSDRMRS